MRRNVIYHTVATVLCVSSALSVALGGEILKDAETEKRQFTTTRDEFGVPHIVADSDLEVAFGLGVAHAEDRLFQMDVTRRTALGTLSELLGPAALAQDVQLRVLGIGRAASATLPVLGSDASAWLAAYADGVNSVLSDTSRPLPPEYAALELSRSSIPPWTAMDSVAVLKYITFGLSFDLVELDATSTLAAYLEAGSTYGFDGSALYFQDLFRSAPFDPTASVSKSFASPKAESSTGLMCGSELPEYLKRGSALIRRTADQLRAIPALADAMTRRTSGRGSNWWLVGGSQSESGYPILASDPHLALNTPATYYQAILEVVPGADPAMRVTGASFPGVPAIVNGCNPRGCWSGATDPVDVTDIYLESVIIDSATGNVTHTMFDGSPEPVVAFDETYLVNQIGDGTLDNLVDSGIGPASGGRIVVVPRRNNGALISIDFTSASALSVQFTGQNATREIEALIAMARAYTTNAFSAALQSWDTGSQSWAWSDIDGNIAYFASGEVPIREDLQTLQAADGGVPPFLVRDGTHSLSHEWMAPAAPDPARALDYEVLPFAELPQSVNPSDGWLFAANNDPIGATFDNDPLNQLRPGGGVLYLGPGYAAGIRAGRIALRVGTEISGGADMSVEESRSIQGDSAAYDAAFFVPYIVNAWAVLGPTWPGPDAVIMAEAVARLGAWDQTTPTGIQAGYDPGDDPDNLPAPSAAEIDNSVAATIYAMWRGRIVERLIDDTLASVGGLNEPGSSASLIALRKIFGDFPSSGGVGASGLQFIPGGDLDGAVLGALSDALAELAGADMNAAFGGSTALADYRWGRLHRIVFDHVLGGSSSIPPGGGLSDLEPALPGVPRSGGLATIDLASHSVRADGSNEFQFGSGAARRFVSHLLPTGIEICDIIPGGASGVPSDAHFADQLPLWLTHQCRTDVLAPLTQDLAVTVSGSGSGVITSTPAGIDCGTDCSESYPWGNEIVLVATPAAGSAFVGFTGDPDCVDGVVTMTADLTCVAEFADVTVAATATKTVSGQFVPGGAITYVIALGNLGPGDQTDNLGDEFTDVLSDQLQLIGASASSGVATADSGTRSVAWNGSIAAGDQVTITIDARLTPEAAGIVTNQGTMWYDGNGDDSNDTFLLTDDPSTATVSDPTSFTVNTAAGIPVSSMFGRLLLIAMIATLGLGLMRRRA